jgi:hypothetical protein
LMTDPVPSFGSPGLLFIRPTRDNLPHFIERHLREQEACLLNFFEVSVVPAHRSHKLDITRRPRGQGSGSAQHRRFPRDPAPRLPALRRLLPDAQCLFL